MLDFATPLQGIRSPFGRRQGGAAFSPTALFALAEPGVWFDPSDLATLFQDTAGTTPVTTPGQTVGLMLDKSKGLVLGTEVMTNGGPAFTSTAGWLPYQTGSNFSIVGGNLVAVDDCYFPITGLIVGRTYEVRYSVVSGMGLNLYANADATGNAYIQNKQGVGSARFALVNPALGVYLNAGTTLASISVRELAGNHAVQATAVARPNYAIEPAGGRRNLLTWSEDLTNAAWGRFGPTVTGGASDPLGGTAAVTITGGGTVQQGATLVAGTSYTFSIYLRAEVSGTWPINFYDGTNHNTVFVSVTTSWLRFSITKTATGTNCVLFAVDTRWIGAGSLSSVYAWGAQVEIGSTATAYQKVTTQHDVTEAGVASVGYLYFDGVNDAMVTSTITPGTDKVQVFAGVRKLSDAASIIVESSAISAGNNGSFLLAHNGTGAPTGYNALSRGSAAAVEIGANGYLAPISNVLALTGDISGDRATLRINGAQVAQSTADQGTGNFLAYPLYLGGRAGTSVFFNGHLYSLITRFGPTLDAPTIASTETWVAGKTGFYTPIITGVPTIGVS